MTAHQHWIDRVTLERATGWTPRTIQRKVENGELQSRASNRRGKNGKPEKEYVVGSLAADLQLKLATMDRELALTRPPDVSTQRELPLATQPEVRNFIPEQQQERDRRMALIAPLLAASEGRLPKAKLRDGRAIQNLADVAEWIASQHKGVSPRALRHYYALYKKRGIDALAPKLTRADRGEVRSFRNNPGLQRFVVAKFTEGLGYSHIEEIVAREWGGADLPVPRDARKKPPSRHAIARFIEQIPPSVRDAALLPKQKWESKHAPYLVTGRGEHTRPNEVWVADHRIYDVLSSNDCFDQAPEAAAIRLWETCIQDMRTRVIVGSVWSVSPSWMTIATALRQGISKFGKPEIFYTDNGKDFRKVGTGAERGSLLTASSSSAAVELDEDGRVPMKEGLLARLGIKFCPCTPRHPQSKQVESYFNFVSRRFDRLFLRHGYTGPKPELRTDFCREAEKQHKEFLTGKRRESPLVPASRFVTDHEQWLEEYNAKHHHGGRGMDGCTPLEVMDELLPLPLRQIPDMAELEPLFWDSQKRKVSNCKVQLNNTTYSALLSDADGVQNMYLANDRVVVVRCDPNDMAAALAFEDVPGGKLIARLISDDLASEKPITAEQVKAISRARAKLRKTSVEAIKQISRGVPSEREFLEHRASLRATGTDDSHAPRSFSFKRLPASTEVPPSPFVSDAVEAFIAANKKDGLK
jgi:hypothetical protein